MATASSKVDVGATGITASLFNMAASGQQLAIVADKGREQKGFSSSALLVTSDNYNNGITKLEEQEFAESKNASSANTQSYQAAPAPAPSADVR